MTGFLHIVGPGPTTMYRAYREADLQRMAICRDAVILLRQTHRDNLEAGDREIIEALTACGWEAEL